MSIEAMKQALEKATEVMEAACIRVDELKAENESLRQSIAGLEKQEHGSPEDMYVEMHKHLNCPHCGGSGHIDDVAEKQEPHGYLKLINSKFYHEVEGAPNIDNNPEFLALYTHPQPKREPLTDEQILRLLSRIDECAVRLPRGLREFARAIEAVHGIKGEA